MEFNIYRSNGNFIYYIVYLKENESAVLLQHLLDLDPKLYCDVRKIEDIVFGLIMPLSIFIIFYFIFPSLDVGKKTNYKAYAITNKENTAIDCTQDEEKLLVSYN